MKLEHVDGRKKGKIVLYALSTCVWCKKTRALLKEIGVDYFYIYVDLVTGDEKEEVLNEVIKWNPSSSFPTMVIDDKDCITGYKPQEIRERLG